MPRKIVTEIIADATQFNATVNQAAATAGQFGAKLDGVANSGGFKSIVQGIGVGLGITAFGLLDKALSSTVDVLSTSLTAYNEQQQGQAALAASLKANVPGWTASTNAIENFIEAQASLGFMTTDVRDGLTRLFPVTHDVTDAYRMLSAAEDLARFKGISLIAAVQALINIDGGRYKALGQLIGSTKEITTAEQALAAVEAAAAGASESYANSELGRIDAIHAKLQLAEERIGKDIQPAQAAFLGFVASGLDGWAMLANGVEEAARNHRRDIGAMTYDDAMYFLRLQQDQDAATKSRQDFDRSVYQSNQAQTESGAMRLAAQGRMDNEQARSAHELTLKQQSEYRSNESSWNTMTYDIRSNMVITKQSVQQQFLQLTDYIKNRLTDPQLVNILSGRGSMGAQMLAALRSAHPDVVQEAGSIVLGLIGKMTTPQLQAVVSGRNAVGAQLLADLQSHNAGIRAAAAHIMAGVEAELNTRTDIVVNIIAGNRNSRMALGGPVSAGNAYIVGDAGKPEVFVPTQDGTIIPSVSQYMNGGGGMMTTPGPLGLSLVIAGNVYGGPSGIDELAALISARLRLGGATR